VTTYQAFAFARDSARPVGIIIEADCLEAAIAQAQARLASADKIELWKGAERLWWALRRPEV
jgi:hypothetical protein